MRAKKHAVMLTHLQIKYVWRGLQELAEEYKKLNLQNYSKWHIMICDLADLFGMKYYLYKRKAYLKGLRR